MSNIRLDQIKIPAAPLVAYVERLGGAAELPGMGVTVVTEAETRDSGTPKDLHTRDQTPEEWRRLRSTQQQLRRISRQGWITLTMADEFCCDVLNIHPMEVWGLDWFDFGLEEEEMAA